MPTKSTSKSVSKKKAPVVSTEDNVDVPSNAAAYAELIEKYKEQNPVKYEAKKAELEAKLAALS